MIEKHLVSSAKRKTSTDGEDTDEGRSFTYIKNNKGPRIDPCGTPEVMKPNFDFVNKIKFNLIKYHNKTK